MRQLLILTSNEQFKDFFGALPIFLGFRIFYSDLPKGHDVFNGLDPKTPVVINALSSVSGNEEHKQATECYRKIVENAEEQGVAPNILLVTNFPEHFPEVENKHLHVVLYSGTFIEFLEESVSGV